MIRTKVVFDYRFSFPAWPDPATWGDVIGTDIAPGPWILAFYTPPAVMAALPVGMPIEGFVDYVSTGTPVDPFIRIVLIFDGPPQETDLSVLQTIVGDAADEPAALAALAMFTTGTMSYANSYVELMSDEMTP